MKVSIEQTEILEMEIRNENLHKMLDHVTKKVTKQGRLQLISDWSFFGKKSWDELGAKGLDLKPLYS
ncbi:hypothetical protein ACFY5J_24845 [Peribacillus butanolivorans]|uniref:hypothetical protein n=1 Tax=Peribacillus butanolivorans TaxID=421767 RepID=UPI0036C37487